MADDIDIEEHDVLESLRRRQEPEETVIKSEPLDIEYSEPQYDDHTNEHTNNHWSWDSQNLATKIKEEPPDEDEFQFGKIILGSKPSVQAEPENQTLARNSTHENTENYNYNMSLVLKDWGPVLKNSKCYCQDCQILFATVNALDAHKMVAHSFLIATDKEASPERNKAIKSTAKPSDSTSESDQTCHICNYYFKGQAGRGNLMRHYRNVHNVDPTVETKKFKGWKVCNHCNNYFPNDTALVKHLYELLPVNNNSPTKDDKKVVNDNLKVKPVIKTYEKKVVKPIPKPLIIPSPSKVGAKNIKVENTANINVKGAIAKNTAVKRVQATNSLKQANSLILGSKINTNQVNIKKEDESHRKLGRKCEACGIEYSRRYYLKHMKKFHPEKIVKLGKSRKSSSAINSTTVKTVSGPNARYKCKICGIILNGKAVAKNHRKLKHPQEGSRRILIQLVKATKIQKVKPVKKKPVKSEVQEESTDIVVAKSTLFKCNRCSVHFLTCCGACAHSRVCETSNSCRDWSCPQCQRVFKSVDRKAHEFQHETITAKFKVYVVYLEMVVRILCECPYCYVCFEEYKFWRHINFGCDRDAESFYCNVCHIVIDASSRTSHESKHTQGDFTKEDFIKIDFVASKKDLAKNIKVEGTVTPKEIPAPSLKRKLAMPDVSPKKAKNEDFNHLFNLFYCPTCKSCTHTKVAYHLEGKCKELSKIKRNKTVRQNCQHCGITFSINALFIHRKLHKRYPKLSISDLTFTRITDDKIVKPQPELYKCKTCHVYFTTKAMRRRHPCGDVKSTICKVCHKNVSRLCIKSHMRIHDYVIPSKAKLAVKPKVKVENDAKSIISYNSSVSAKSSTKSNKPKKPQSPMPQLPQLLMKYQSLTTLWNILYVCSTCDTFTDSYDKVVEHCQNHFTNMESYGVVIMKCQICNMKFDRECYRRHLELHAGSMDISKKSFQILKYDFSKLFSAEWLSFIDLPDDQKSQILTRSIYGEGRNVRLKLVQQGPPEFTLYRCDQCLTCVPPASFVSHIKLDCAKGIKVECSMCDTIFASKPDCDEHEKIHETADLEAESFRIVAFNNASDIELNKVIMPNVNLKMFAKLTRDSPNFVTKHRDNVKTVKGKKFYMFYKCKNCDVCVLSKLGAKFHVCSDIHKKKCSVCGLLFTYTNMGAHRILHEKFNFSSENVFTRSFDNSSNSKRTNEIDNGGTRECVKAYKMDKKENDVKKEDAKLYKCHCGLHYTSLKAIEKHYLGKNCSAIVREKCSQCNLIFDPIEVVNHLCKHHARGQIKNFEIITPNKKTLYKCDICHVLFYDRKIADIHRNQCQGKFNAIKCDECGLAFDASSVDTHKNDHKANGQLKPDCYFVVGISEGTKKQNVLYKCEKCDIHYLLRKAATKHVVEYNHFMTKSKICTECGLKFPMMTLLQHQKLHHKNNKIIKFDIKYVDAVGTIRVAKTMPDDSTMSSDVNDQSDQSKEHELYKCKKCGLHFTDENTLLNHNQDRCSKELNEVCEVCDLKFATKNMSVHLKQHNIGGVFSSINEIDGEANDEDDSQEISGDSNKLYRCGFCDLHYNVKKSLTKHLIVKCKIKQGTATCEKCNILFTKNSLARHKALHSKLKLKKTDFRIIKLPANSSILEESTNATDEIESQASCNETVASLDSSVDVESTNHSKPDASKVKLYKCGECNVYFLTQRACYKHVVKHTTLEPKEYIECKLCNFQFTIMSLQSHIKKHHSIEFKLDEVLIEEYRPNDLKNKVPKIEIYYASEKEQSGLVSTTSDVKNDVEETVDTSEVIENDIEKKDDVDSNEITSNENDIEKKDEVDSNEITSNSNEEKAHSSVQNDSQIVNTEGIVDQKEAPVGVSSSDIGIE